MIIKRSLFARRFALLLSLCLVPVSLQAEEQQEYIAITKQGTSRIAIVIDRTGARPGPDLETAKAFDNTVRSALNFVGQFNLLPAPYGLQRDRFGVPVFSSLRPIGAEAYSGGAMSRIGMRPTFDMSVYDVQSGKLLLRRAYPGEPSQVRSSAYQFSSDLIELLTGRKCRLFGTKIVFVSNRSGFKEVYQCDFDGQNVVQLTTLKSISLTPTISPDGKYLAWTDYTSGRPDLHIRNLVERRTVTVSRPGVNITPAWRPGTDELAATLTIDGDQELFLIKPDGKISKRLTYSRGIDVSPTFSPDGSKFAFVSQRSGMPQIFVQDVDSGFARRLTFSGNYNTQPSWSPAGDKIAFSSLKNGEINIFTIKADGSGLQQLTGGSALNEYPSWSPDGSMIVFTSTRQGRRKVFMMNADGTNQRVLMQADGDQQQPSWSRTR